jgi:thioredoxin reductase (NADPH)
MVEKVVIIGSGPAGLSAAIYTGRAKLNPLVIEGTLGGQITLSPSVENYPGFPEGINGSDLVTNMKRQAERFGARFISENATDVDVSARPFRIKTETRTIEAETIIAATGARTVWLGLPNEQRLIGRGVSSCATCDAFFFMDKAVMVVGGGDTALEDAIFLTRFAKSVTVIHRRSELRASKIMQDRAFANPKIKFIWDTTVEDVLGAEIVEGIKLKNVKTGHTTEMKCDGVFIAIGYKPATDIFKGRVETGEGGYALTQGKSTMSNVEGIFIAGDVSDPRYRQAITAASEGCKAAMDVAKYLESKHSEKK